MDKLVKEQLENSIRNFKLPRYKQLPDVGLYLEQTVLYINQYLVPLGCAPITNSMVSNYVKKGVLPGPTKKQYYSKQLSHLMVIAITKNVLSLENIQKLFHMQKGVYTDQIAYDYFCSELENMLLYTYGIKETVEQIGVTNTDLKTMLRGVIIAVSQMIYVQSCFEIIEAQKNE